MSPESRSGQRIPPLPTDEWSDDAVAALRAVYGEKVADVLLSDAPDSREMPNALATMMRHPGLSGPFLIYNNTLLQTPVLHPRLREVMVLRVAWHTRSPYEWVQHVALAPRVKITAAEIDAIALGADADVWSPLESDLLRATDQLLDHYRIDDETWRRLSEQLDESQLLEVTFVVGTYTCLAMVFNSIGLELDPGLDTSAAPPLPDRDG